MHKKIQKKIVIVFAIIACLCLLVPLVTPILSARADTVAELQDKLSAAEKARKEAEAGLSKVKQNISSAQSKRQALDLEISGLETEIYELTVQIEENEKAIGEVTRELEEAEKDAKEYEGTYKERVRVMYERSHASFLNILFGASDFSDLLKRVEVVSQIVEYDRTVMQRMAEARAKIEEKKKNLEEANAVVELNREILNTKKAEIDANKAALGAIILDLESDAAAYRAALDEADRAEEALRAEIRALSSPSSSTTTVPTADSGGQLCWPTPSTTYITSPYGTRFHPVQQRMKTHTGIDIGAGHGASILAAESGTVLRADYNSGYGNYVVIDHGGGVQTLYGHCSALLVKSGQSVSRGQQIALVGSTGVSTGPHLHFEVLINGAYTDPMGYFD